MFSHGGGKKTAEPMNVPFLGELPLDPAVRVGGDSGQPVTLGMPALRSWQSRAKCSGAPPRRAASAAPAIKIED